MDALDRSAEFIAQVETFLSDNDSDALLSHVFEESNQASLELSCVDILHLLGCKLLDAQFFNNDRESWRGVATVFDYVVQKCKPKECLLAILEKMEHATPGSGPEDETFALFLSALRTIFVRLPEKRDDTFLWALYGIYAYVRALPMPDFVATNAAEFYLYEQSREIGRIVSTIEQVLAFLAPFVDEIHACQSKSELSKRESRNHLTSFLLKILEWPIAGLDFGIDHQDAHGDTIDNGIIRVCGAILDALVKLWLWNVPQKIWKLLCRGDFSLRCRFIDNPKKRVTEVGTAGFGVAVMLMFCLYGKQTMAEVYRKSFLFEQLALPSMNSLFCVRHDQDLCKSKALALSGYFLRFLEAEGPTLPGGQLENGAFRDFFANLVRVTAYCNVELYRKRALAQFRGFLDILEPNEQIKLIRYLFATVGAQEVESAENGIRGYLIDFYRQKLANNRGDGSGAFVTELPSMMQLFTHLPQQEETDLMEFHEQYMAALNLIRYVGLVNKLGPKMRKTLETKFLTILQKAIEISKAHYELDLKHIDHEFEGNVQVGTGTMQGTEMLDRGQILRGVVVRLDMMQSVVGRVFELLRTLKPE